MANKNYKNRKKPFKWKCSVGELILGLARWYSRYALSYHDLQKTAQEHGLSLNCSSVYHWVQEYAPEITKRIKLHLKKTSDFWKYDGREIKIKGKWHHLYQAIDKNGNTPDWMLTRTPNKKSAQRFFKKVFRNFHTVAPRVIHLDKSPTISPALSERQVANDSPPGGTYHKILK